MAMVTVVIPAYKVERFIADAVESALRQTHTDVEVLVIDDGSPDRSVQVATAAARGDPRIRVLSFPNAGLPAARNRGLAAAKGEFIAQLDADDCWDDEKLAKQLAVFDGDPDTVLVGCLMRHTDAQGHPLRRLGPLSLTLGEDMSDPAKQARARRADIFPCHVSSMVLRTDIVRRVGGSDETLPHGWGEDVDLMARVAAHGRIHVVMEVLGSHRVHGASMLNRGQIHNARNYRFVQKRLAARAGGADLTFQQFEAAHPITFFDRRMALALTLYQAARLQAVRRRFPFAAGLLLVATATWPEFLLHFTRTNVNRWFRSRSPGL